MGSLNLTISIENMWLLLIFMVLIIAFCAVVGIFAWWQKSDRQMETLEDINKNIKNNSISPNSSSQLENSKEGEQQKIDAESKLEPVFDAVAEATEDYLEDKSKLEDTKVEDTKVEVVQDKSDNYEDDEDLEPLIDIAALVREAAKEEATKKQSPQGQSKVCRGKSGKVYTLEELEQLIDN